MDTYMYRTVHNTNKLVGKIASCLAMTDRPKEVKNVKLKVKSKQDGKIASCLAMTGLAKR